MDLYLYLTVSPRGLHVGHHVMGSTRPRAAGSGEGSMCRRADAVNPAGRSSSLTLPNYYYMSQDSSSLHFGSFCSAMLP
jgi:hypothetical protein